MTSLLLFLRFLFFSLPLLLLLGGVVPSASLLLWLLGRGQEAQFDLARFLARALLAASFVRVECEGLEKLQAAAPLVVVANHPSYLDIPVLLHALPVPFRFLATRSLFRHPWLSIPLRAGGHFPLEGGAWPLAFSSVKSATRLLREQSVSILIFPEELHNDANLHAFREGAAYVSIKAGVPVVPIALLGTRELMRMRGTYLASGVVTVRAGEPIAATQLRDSDRAWLTGRLFDEMADLLDRAPAESCEPMAEPQ